MGLFYLCQLLPASRDIGNNTQVTDAERQVMAEEVKQQQTAPLPANPGSDVSPDAAQFTETVSMDDIVGSAKVYVNGIEVDPQTNKPIAPATPAAPKADAPSEPKPGEKPGEAKPEESKPSAPEFVPEQVEQWKKAWENRDKWEKTLKQRSQAVAKLQKLTPEQQELLFAKVMPYVYGEEKIPDTPDDLIKEAITKLSDVIPEELTLQDEDGIDVIVPKEHYEPIVKKAVGEVVKRYLPELATIRSDYMKLNDEYQKAIEYGNGLAAMNGEIIVDHFGKENAEAVPLLLEGERPSQALRRIYEAGEDHPEYSKYLKFRAAAELRTESLQKGKNLTFEQAWQILYGDQERKTAQQKEIEKDILEKQKNAIKPEAPGQAVQKSKADEAFDIMGGKSHEELVAEFFK